MADCPLDYQAEHHQEDRQEEDHLEDHQAKNYQAEDDLADHRVVTRQMDRQDPTYTRAPQDGSCTSRGRYGTWCARPRITRLRPP